ncbi:MAG: hypothetical protein U9O97_01645 [Elusimicrobiota bacterium]|nr:hypothetical protein [Elusimicrobiota bacterium]
MLPGIIPKIVIAGAGEWKFEFEFDRIKKITPILDDLLTAVSSKADREKKKAVVVFDEFQEITNYGDDEIERKMRSVFQSHNNVSYIFMGSKRHMMNELFNNSNRPFYRSGKHFPLGKIEKTEFKTFIEKWLKSGKYQCEEGVIEHILDVTESHPYYTQMLCHIIWEEARNYKIDKKTVELSVEKLFAREADAFFSVWESLSNGQSKLLLALARDETSEIYGSKFIKRYNISSPSSVQKAVKALTEKEIIIKEDGIYKISDIFLKEWLRIKF